LSCEEDRLEVSSFGGLTGIVVSQDSNEPLENVKISTSPASGIVFTDAEGRFSLDNVSVGTYSVQAQKEGFIAKFESGLVSPDVVTNLVFELLSNNSNNSSPQTPNLLLPLINSVNVPLSVNLDWEVTDSDEDDLSYNVKIYNNQNSDLIEITGLTESMYDLTNLMYNTKYFWQIEVSDGVNDLVLSEVFNFTTLEFPDNRIFYTKKENGNNVIYSMNDSGVEFRLTSTNENSWRPRKASGLNRIAYLKSVGSQTHIFTMDLDGSNQVQVTNAVSVNGFNLDELDFEWKSNNTKIIFPNFNTLYQINLSGNGLLQLYQTTNGNFITELDWCAQTQEIAIKTNNNQGYNVEVFTINSSGVIQDMVLSGVNGAAGGIDFNFQGDKLLYTFDDSQAENLQYRQLNANMYLYDITSATAINLSQFKVNGTNDLDPKFSPNDASVIFVNTSNDGVSQKNIYVMSLSDAVERTLTVENGYMPDWK
jgi:hypothetical protein